MANAEESKYPREVVAYTFLRLVHPLKAFAPIFHILDGILMVSTVVQFMKASSAMEVTAHTIPLLNEIALGK